MKRASILKYGLTRLSPIVVLCIVGSVCCSSPYSISTGRPTLQPTASQPSTLPLLENWCIQSASGISHPLIGDKLVFTVDAKQPTVTHRVYDMATGSLVWTATSSNNNGGAGLLGYWLVEGDRYVTGDDSSITAFATQTGAEVWEKEVLGNRGFSVGDGKLFVSTLEAITAYDLATGTFLWQTEGQGRYSTRPFYDPTSHLLVANQKTYRLIDPDTGTVKFDTDRPPQDLNFSYDFGGGLVYNDLLLYIDEAIDVKSGRIVHPRSLPSLSYDLPFIADHFLLISTYKSIVSVDLNSFSEVWRHQLPITANTQLEAVSNPVVLSNAVYVILSDASIRALDFRTGTELGQWQGHAVVDNWGMSTPLVPGLAVGNEMLFASFGTNELCAFGPRH
jgi:outer membrane protein assembly factor BamB